MTDDTAGVSKDAGKSLITPFNVIAGVIVVIGLWLTFKRFTGGLAEVTNLSNKNPWGIWIGFDLLTGVALAAGGYVTAAGVYIFGMKKYHSAVRPAVLTGFLGYFFVVIALLYDVGRPWRLPYPFIMQQGTTSVMFEVAACVSLYLTVLFLEFSPVVAEWLGFRKVRNLAIKLTLALTIMGVVLSTMHQSSLGAMFLLTPTKLHPLWYSPYLPVFFFVSSIVAGLSIVIFESSLSGWAFRDKIDDAHRAENNQVVLGFGKAASMVLAGYFLIKMAGVAHGDHWHLLGTGYGLWYLLEVVGFVLLPCFLYAVGVRERNLKLIRWTSVIAVLGIVLNRFNVSLIAFNWQLPPDERYVPSWEEVGITVFVVTVFLLVFRFVATRMPVFHEHPDFKGSH
jgi:Ni/Fe-hydrogenase subunit HybB-like protein